MRQLRQSRKLGLLLAAVIVGVLVYFYDQFRTRHIVADEPMTWECTTHARMYPGPAVVRRFVRAPEYNTFQSDPTGSFCRFLAEGGKTIVLVHADLWGNKRDGLTGWNEITINKRTSPIPQTFGGDGSEGQPTHPHPYAQDFDAALHRRSRQ